MKNWVGPIVLALLAGIAGWHGALALSTFGLMEAAIRRVSMGGGMNVMHYGTLPTPANQPIVRPSPDLAYSTCPYDLSKGPVLISVTPVPGRYTSLSIFDARTDVAFVRNDVQAGGKPFDIVLARVGQPVPAGKEVVRVGYDRGIALVRQLLNAPSEIATLDGIRRKTTCRSLTA